MRLGLDRLHRPTRFARVPQAARSARAAADPDLVRDVSPPAFAQEAHRQSRAVARSRQDEEDQDFIDSISDANDQ